MEPYYVILAFVLFGGLAVVFRLLAGSLDRSRIEAYITSNGGRVESVSWAPFGPGWFGEKSDRIYQVRYVDRLGQAHDAHCKTSLTTGVYLTEDRVRAPLMGMPPTVRSAPQTDEAELLAENRRLREELARLKRERGDQ